jgi:RNA polymerase sigma-70 factor (ECF subfamily)
MSQSLNATRLQAEPDQENGALTFATVFRDYQSPIYNYLLRMTQNPADAEDLTQETFIRVHSSLSTFRGEASLSTWLYRIATNVSYDYFRRKSTRQAKIALSLEETDVDWKGVRAEPPASPEQLSAQSDMSACVEGFIDRLPPSYRAVLVLHDVQGLKNSEIADVLQCSLETVKIRLHRARKTLRATLNAGCDFAHDERAVFVCETKAGSDEGSAPNGGG